jgi:hypothetical protein
VTFYDKHIDDYSIVFLSTLLHLASVKPLIMQHYALHREPPFAPKQLIGGGRLLTSVLRSVVEEFTCRGMAREYQVAMMLASPFVRLCDLMQTFTQESFSAGDVAGATLEFDARGRWGIQSRGEWLLAPLYTSGVGISEGVALMELGTYRHFVRLSDGCVLRSFDKSTNVGPLRGGCTRARMVGGEEQIIEIAVD